MLSCWFCSIKALSGLEMHQKGRHDKPSCGGRSVPSPVLHLQTLRCSLNIGLLFFFSCTLIQSLIYFHLMQTALVGRS
jgi:hypothetical protein